MAKKTAVQQMESLFQQTESIREQFTVALENAENEVAELIEAIEEGEKHLQDIYKNYVLNIVSLDAYQSEKKLLDDKKAILHVAEKKVADIDELMKGELSEVYSEAYSLLIGDFSKEERQIVADRKKAMLKAKHDYLKAVRSIGEEVISVQNNRVWMSVLEVELGLKSYNYTSAVKPEQFLSNSYDSTVGAEISVDEFNGAYAGKFDYKLLNEIE
ncbi:hypothetical protein SporoP37_02415 [Sporosarcina sp. P37]|uniref:hypothetical protein n=1 Tax=unclassified Sporosarcina TaxID=2647733 RepID=UPI000A17B247|nr:MULTISPECIES: hypothetical protein [unclassified Sporosarcina]ARK23655.1 hypothetical protein SporoP37_02415 [Sporosarcina sp. P37]PID18720.1 hypothetical protein CSV62_06335 [Sporosarcina sp. P35]